MPNAHREQLYGSTKAATQPSRLRSADGAFWGVLTHPDHRFALVVGTCAASTADDCHHVTIDPDDRTIIVAFCMGIVAAVRMR